MAEHTPAGLLAAGKYLLLTTYRRTGVPVATPVWVAPDAQALVVWTRADSGKVKRIRNNGEVTVAPCTVRGRQTGPASTGRAVVLDAAGSRRVAEIIGRKYGLMGRLGVAMSRWRRGEQGTVGIQITVVEPGGTAG